MSGILIVGDGRAAVRLTCALRQRGNRGPVTVLGRGPRGQQRALLTSVLDGSLDFGSRLLPDHPDAVRMIRGVVTRIDRRRRLVHARPETDSGSSTAGRLVHPYDALVLATGARPRLPRFPGLFTPGGRLSEGVTVPYTPKDCTGIAPGRVIVLGAGQQGVEAALALRRGGRDVALVDSAELPMARHLDGPASRLLTAYLVSTGVELHLGRTAVEYVPGKVMLDDGGVLAADALLPCTGTLPRRSLALGAGLAVRRGILVDDRLCTNDPHISAVGGCAEKPDRAPRPGPVACDQTDALAARLAGTVDSRTAAGGSLQYAPAAPPEPMRLRDPGIDVAVLGSHRALDDAPEQVTLHDPVRHRYARLALRDRRIEGAVLVGLPDAIAAVTELHRRGLPVPAERLALLQGTTPRGAPTSGPPVDTVLCRCNHVTLGRLTASWRRGARDVPRLAEATRATTGCGGCVPDLERLCAELASQPSLSSDPGRRS